MRGHYESESWEQGRRILNSQQFKQIGAIGHCPNQEPFGSRSAQAVGRDARSRSTVSTIVGYLYGPAQVARGFVSARIRIPPSPPDL